MLRVVWCHQVVSKLVGEGVEDRDERLVELADLDVGVMPGLVVALI